MTSHILSVLVENRSGVLSRVSGLFSRRGFNIESLAVGTCEEKDLSRITIVVKGDDAHIEQVKKQLNKLIDVVTVRDITYQDFVERELALIKVHAEQGEARSGVIQIADLFRAKIIDVGQMSVVLEVTGDSDKIDAIENLLRDYGICELVRTGRIALQRGPKTISDR